MLRIQPQAFQSSVVRLGGSAATHVFISNPSFIEHLLCEWVDRRVQEEKDRHMVFLSWGETDKQSAIPLPSRKC